MQKIKYQVIKKCIEKRITDAELTIMMHIAQYQNEKGQVMGVYYRDICSATGLSFQTFYNVLYALRDKEIITLIHTDNGDFDVSICENSFEDGDFSCGYISMRRHIFRSKSFANLKVCEKLMLMDIISVASSGSNKYCCDRSAFYEKYTKMFQVTKRMIRDYLRTIKKMCNFFNFAAINHQYEFVLTKSAQINVNEQSDEKKHDKRVTQVLCRHNKIKEYSEQELKEAAGLIHQYQSIAALLNRDIFEVFSTCIRNSIDVINRYKTRKEKKEYSLRYKLIHNLIKKELNWRVN